MWFCDFLFDLEFTREEAIVMIPSVPQLFTTVAIFTVIFALPYVIFAPTAKKAGFSKWWSLLLIVPVANIVVIWVFSTISWPAEKGSGS